MAGFVFFLAITGWCGYKWTRLLCSWSDHITTHIPLSFVLGFCWFTIFSIIAYTCQSTFMTFTVVYVPATVAFLFWPFEYPPRERSFIIKQSEFTALIIVCLIGILLCMYLGGFMGGDGTFHQAKIQNLLNKREFANNDPYLQNVKDDRYYFSVWHSFLAINLSHIDQAYKWVPFLWFYIPAVIITVVILSQYTFAAILFNRSIAGVIAAIIWVVHFLILAYTDSRYWTDGQTLNYPSGICIHLFTPIGLGLYLRSCEYYKNNPWITGIILGLIIWVIALIHLFYSLLFIASLIFLCTAMGIYLWNFNVWKKQWIKPTLISFLVSFPWLIFRTVSLSTIKNPFFLSPHGWATKFKFFNDNAYILDPRLTFFSLGHYQTDRIVLAAIIISIIALLLVRKYRWAAYVAISTLITVVVVSVPVIVTTIASAITAYKIPRLTLLIPVTIAATGGILFLTDMWFFKKKWFWRTAVILIAMTALFWVYQDAWTRYGYLKKWLQAQNMHRALTNPSMLNARELFAYENNRPTILGDEGQTYVLGAYYPLWAVSLPAAHAPISFEYRHRNNIFRFLTGKQCTPFDIQRLASDYEADFLILKKDTPVIDQLKPALIQTIWPYHIFRLPLIQNVFEKQLFPLPWLDYYRWIKKTSTRENNISSWGPGHLIKELTTPTGLDEKIFGRVMVTDGLDRTIVYEPILPATDKPHPSFVSFWLYLEEANGISIDRLSVTWHSGTCNWSHIDLKNLKLTKQLHNGWNAILLEINPNDIIPKKAHKDDWGLYTGLHYKPTDPPKHVLCGMRDITLYVDRNEK